MELRQEADAVQKVLVTEFGTQPERRINYCRQGKLTGNAFRLGYPWLLFTVGLDPSKMECDRNHVWRDGGHAADLALNLQHPAPCFCSTDYR